jgi:hypothetical protein
VAVETMMRMGMHSLSAFYALPDADLFMQHVSNIWSGAYRTQE